MKRRVLVVLMLAAVVGGLAPARATHATWWTGGTVQSSVWHPTAARILYERSSATNGRVGVVIPLPSDAGGATYTLTRTSGLGVENLDAFFYVSIASTASAPLGVACASTSISRDDADVEQGTICPGGEAAAWAIVTLRAGANVDFTFSYRRPHGP